MSIAPTSSASPTAKPTPKPTERTIEPSVPCFGDVQCSDGDPCTVDLCTIEGCINQERSCDDNNLCTRDFCSKKKRECVHELVSESCESEIENCRRITNCAECTDSSNCEWLQCRNKDDLKNITSFWIQNKTAVFYNTRKQKFAFLKGNPSKEIATFSVGDFVGCIVDTQDERVLMSIQFESESCVAKKINIKELNGYIECDVSDCEPTNFLVGQRAEILASFGAAAGSATTGCAMLITVVICYRRKKERKVDPLGAKLRRNEAHTSQQGISDTNMLYDSTPRNPLFVSNDPHV
eukprot:TRINITY_DN13805_c0_g1_i1.p1 TRINITY_DN13805_c0_g1~~TRINITY_DN13805_c0_g1_i1.p1  ORF type:complete len:294 (+),score=51.79 TRINITY_DN13805_c0_g1_i1:238-1119(+)